MITLNDLLKINISHAAKLCKYQANIVREGMSLHLRDGLPTGYMFEYQAKLVSGEPFSIVFVFGVSETTSELFILSHRFSKNYEVFEVNDVHRDVIISYVENILGRKVTINSRHEGQIMNTEWMVDIVPSDIEAFESLWSNQIAYLEGIQKQEKLKQQAEAKRKERIQSSPFGALDSLRGTLPKDKKNNNKVSKKR